MFKCEICGREFKSVNGLILHIRQTYKIKMEEYYLEFINPEKGICKTCGKDTKFIGISKGYNKFCCNSCSSLNPEVNNKRKLTCVKKYGVDNPSKCEELKNKKKDTCMKNFGVSNPMKCKELYNKAKDTCRKNFGVDNPSHILDFRERSKKTCMKKHGVEFPAQYPDFKEKSTKTFIEKYGAAHPSQNKEIQNKKKETCVKIYGCEHPMQNDEIKNKQKETCNKNFGADNPSQNKEIQNKKKETCNKKYGCDYSNQNEDIRNKSKETCNKKYGVDHHSKDKKISEKMGRSIKLNFQKVEKRYPDLIKIEELISGPNGEILGHCKNSNCKNSKENGGYFELTAIQIWYRNRGINSIKDTSYFYCCEECKHSCPLYRSSCSRLENLLNDNLLINATSTELSIWRTEIFTRQKEQTNIDTNFCEICHSTENLQAHHVIPQKEVPGYALDPDNGMILCQECHLKHGHTKGSECSTGNLANKICNNF